MCLLFEIDLLSFFVSIVSTDMVRIQCIQTVVMTSC